MAMRSSLARGYDTGNGETSADYLVAKYDPEGNLSWRKLHRSLNIYGNAAGAWVYDLALDAYGNTYLTGPTKGSLHGNTPVGGYENSTYYADSFLVKFDPNCSIIYSRQFGAYRSLTLASGIAVDESGRIFIVGNIIGNFPGESRYGQRDYFIAHFDMNGDMQDIQQLGAPGGGSTTTSAHGVATDAAGNIYVAGETSGSIDGVPQVGLGDAFISKYDPSLYRVATQQVSGTDGSGSFRDIASDGSGTVYATGLVAGSEFEGAPIEGDFDSVLMRHNGDWTQKTAGSGGGEGSEGGGSDPTDGSGSSLDWKESWKFVQGDKAVQYRLALVRVEDSHHIFRIQYRVNSQDSIYTSASNGYHLFRIDDRSFDYRVEFPASFLMTEYLLPVEIAVFVDGTNVEWNSTTNNLIYHNSAYGPSGYDSCVDDNSAASRCEGYYQWDRSNLSAEYTAN